MDNLSDWQHPFVDFFKRYNTYDSPKSFKGSVSVIHVNYLFISRILLSPEKHLNFLDPFSQIILLLYLIQIAMSKLVILQEDIFM
jgi:hypothetical protein